MALPRRLTLHKSVCRALNCGQSTRRIRGRAIRYLAGEAHEADLAGEARRDQPPRSWPLLARPTDLDSPNLDDLATGVCRDIRVRRSARRIPTSSANVPELVRVAPAPVADQRVGKPVCQGEKKDRGTPACARTSGRTSSSSEAHYPAERLQGHKMVVRSQSLGFVESRLRARLGRRHRAGRRRAAEPAPRDGPCCSEGDPNRTNLDDYGVAPGVRLRRPLS